MSVSCVAHVYYSTMAGQVIEAVPVTYSEYYHQLEAAAQTRYKEKLAILGGITDPYLTMEQNQDGLA